MYLVDDYPSLAGVVDADRVELPELVVTASAPHVARRLGRLDPLDRVPLIVDSDWPTHDGFRTYNVKVGTKQEQCKLQIYRKRKSV